MFTDVNENDARAAVKVWGQTVAKERGVPVDPEPRILKATADLYEALARSEVDAVGMTAIEYAGLAQKVALDPVFVTYNAGRMEEEYVLLVHEQGPIRGVADLKGRTLLYYQNPRACLAPAWVDTLLAEKGLALAAGFVGKTEYSTKLSKVILPVFFRQWDACVATRSGYETICELNPQVGKQLRIIAVSPGLVPAVFAFRSGFQSAFKDKLIEGIAELHKTPAGQQVLTIFHSDRVEPRPASILQTTLALAVGERPLGAVGGAAAALRGAPSIPTGRGGL
jgi:phosphonate transport system substrate-binding protein